MELFEHLFERFGKISDEAAADAAGIHLGDFDAGVLQKRAVDADLTELVFNQHQLLADVCFGDQLFDERRLACAEKPAENIDFCHVKCLLS